MTAILAAKPGSNASQGLVAAPASNPGFLFEMIVADLHLSALQVGSLAMMSAACVAPGARFGLYACRHLLNDDSGVMRLALRYGESAGLCDVSVRNLDALYVEIAAMQKALQPLAASPELSVSHRDQLARALPGHKRLAALASQRLGELEARTRKELHPNYAEDGAVIRQFLNRAARGDLGEIDRFGVISTPRIKQRRKSPRVHVERSCRIVCAAGEFSATISDVSRAGVGVVCSAPLALGHAVVVIVGGRRLEATVSRREGGQAGLSLTQRLSIDDPLFKGD